MQGEIGEARRRLEELEAQQPDAKRNKLQSNVVQSKQRQLNLPELQSISRITNLPIIETGFIYAGSIYNRLKLSNNLLHWTFEQAEASFYNVLDTASPAVFLLEKPLSKLDQILCKSLDLVEEKVPSINLPPQMIYFNTKQYVSDVGNKIVRPVLKRADSVKQIGNSVLASKYTAFAADKLDGALDVADKYVERYLPGDVFDNPANNDDDLGKPMDGPGGKAIQTSKHIYRFSRKLQRRLTRRTLLEAKALKDQSAEAIHVLVYVAELVATDPKLALQKGRELWTSLSKDEPENQARPENLEQLIVLLSRETARRVVHLVNFTAGGLGKVPLHFHKLVQAVTSSCLSFIDAVVKTVHLDSIGDSLWMTAKTRAETATHLVKFLNIRATDLLEQLVQILTAQKESINSSRLQSGNVQTGNIQTGNPQTGNLQTGNLQMGNLQTGNAQTGNVQENKGYQIIVPQDTLRPPVATRTQLKATHRHPNAGNGDKAEKNSTATTTTTTRTVINGESIKS